MVENFASFVTVFSILGTLIFLGIVFEKQLIALEDKFDLWFEGVKKNVCEQKKTQSSGR